LLFLSLGSVSHDLNRSGAGEGRAGNLAKAGR
jgi:hypothetical protein